MRKGRTLSIKNPKAHRLAEQLSKQLGVTLTEAVIRALENQVQAKPKPKPINWEKVNAILEELRALPVLDTRSEDEILGYDEFGLPR